MQNSVRLGSRRVAWLESGTRGGRTLLLLHAFPLSAAMWRPQLDAVPQGWRVVAPDLPGFGETDDAGGEPPALDDYAADALAVLDHLGVPRVVAAGLSLGGYVALALARLAPGRLEGLVLADTKAPADSADARAGRARLLETLERRGLDGVADEMLPRLLGETTLGTRPELRDEVRALVTANGADGIRRAILRLRDRPDATALLPLIRVPTLVVVGEEDRVTPLSDARALQESIHGAALEILPAAGHLSSLEAPAAFNDTLARFLA